MAENESIADEFECPVCLLIPREVPIPACSVGHIVCQSCRVNVTDCPTCRRQMPEDGTNTLANKLIEKIQHPCKYKQFGCQVKNTLKDIRKHEDNCLNRTIKCPYLECESEVQIRKFHDHAMSSFSCNIHPNNRVTNFNSNFFQSSKNSEPSKILNWKMRAFVDRGKRFYFHMHYISYAKTFGFYFT